MTVLSIELQSKNMEKLMLCEMLTDCSEIISDNKLDLSHEIKYIQCMEKDLDKQIIILKNTIVNDIRNRLKFFEKDSIIVALMSLKQHANSQRHISGHTWKISTLVEISVLLQNITLHISDEEFLNNTLNINVLDFNSARRFYSSKKSIIFDEHITQCLLLANEYLYLTSNEALYKNGYEFQTLDELLEDFFETKDDEAYYDEYLTMGNNLKPELLEVENIDLADWLYHKKIANKNNYDLINSDLKNEIGFNINELDYFQRQVELLFEIQETVPMLINTLENFKKLFKVEDEYLENIIDFFSINRLDKISNVTERHFELRCFYKLDEQVCFGMNDVLESIFMFKNIILSGDFVEEHYFIRPDNIKNLQKSRRNMSTLFAYKIVDKFESNGYVVPYQQNGDKKIPLAEVRDLYNEKGKNIFADNEKDYGDIDILAGNVKDKIIYNIELKYFAPGITYNEVTRKDKMKIKSKYISQIKGRENVIIRYKQLVLECLGIDDKDYEDYRVKSILVTARPNYFAVNKKDGDVEFLSWIKLLDRINEKKI